MWAIMNQSGEFYTVFQGWIRDRNCVSVWCRTKRDKEFQKGMKFARKHFGFQVTAVRVSNSAGLKTKRPAYR